MVKMMYPLSYLVSYLRKQYLNRGEIGARLCSGTLLGALLLASFCGHQAYAQINRGQQRVTLSGSLERATAVKLTWTVENLGKTQSIRIYRATNLGPFQLFGAFQLLRSVEPQQTEYLDDTALAGTGYRYYVETYNSTTVYSLPSNIVEINPSPTPTSGVFVSPTGTAANTGALNSPLDLTTALATQSSARPGTTIWLRSGLYTLPGAALSGTEESPFRCAINGLPGAPITVRSYPGEWAIINGGIRVDGNDLIFRDFEVTNTTVNRELARPAGMTVFGKRIKLINLVIHDTGNAMGLWNSAEATEVYGNVLYRNGWEGPNDTRGNGHGLYIQNHLGTKTIRDNISFDNYATGMKAYGEATAISGVTFEGNIAFNNGSAARPRPDNDRIDNMFVGSKLGAEKIVWANNYAYHPLTSRGTSIRLGYLAPTNKDLVLRDNYFVGGLTALGYVTRWENIVMTGNTFIADREAITLNTPSAQTASAYQWDNNRYFTRDPQRPFTYGVNAGGAGYNLKDWITMTGLDPHSQWLNGNNGRPTGAHVAVRKNQYEAGRAHIAVFNWDLQSAITLSAAQLAGILRTGDTYVIQNAQSLKGNPVLSGTYDGVSIQLPLRGGTLGLEFNAFLLLKTGSQSTVSPAADTAATSLKYELHSEEAADTHNASPSHEPRLNGENLTLGEAERQAINQLNEWRLARQLSPLNLSISLCQASEWSARDMAQREQADTTDSLGRNAAQRARAFGFPGTFAPVDESEWAYAGDATQLFEAAQFNPNMHQAMPQGLSTLPAWKSIGIARVFSPGSGRWYWSVILGAYWDKTILLAGEDEEGRIAGNEFLRTRPPSAALQAVHRFSGYGDDGAPYSPIHCDLSAGSPTCWRDPAPLPPQAN